MYSVVVDWGLPSPYFYVDTSHVPDGGNPGDTSESYGCGTSGESYLCTDSYVNDLHN